MRSPCSRRRHRLTPVLAVVLVASAAPAAFAGPETAGARALGLAGAIRGAATGSAALLENPAALELIHAYIPELDFGYLPEQKGLLETVSVADSTTSKVAAGVYYSHWSLTDPLDAPTAAGPKAIDAVNAGWETGMALAVPIGDIVSIGETTKYLRETTVVPGGPPNGYDRPQNVIDEDLAVDVKAGEMLSAALVGQNLIDPTPASPRTVAAGLAILPSAALLFDVDAVYDLSSGPGTRQSYLAGAEYFLADHYPVRAGFAWDLAGQATWGSLGVGVTTQQLALEIAAEQELSGGHELALAASLRLFLSSLTAPGAP